MQMPTASRDEFARDDGIRFAGIYFSNIIAQNHQMIEAATGSFSSSCSRPFDPDTIRDPNPAEKINSRTWNFFIDEISQLLFIAQIHGFTNKS